MEQTRQCDEHGFYIATDEDPAVIGFTICPTCKKDQEDFHSSTISDSTNS